MASILNIKAINKITQLTITTTTTLLQRQRLLLPPLLQLQLQLLSNTLQRTWPWQL